MPSGDTRRPPPSLASKLDRLFQAVRPGGRGEYSYQEVADAIRAERGPTISATYLWQLRKGLRDNPTRNHLAALARFFGLDSEVRLLRVVAAHRTTIRLATERIERSTSTPRAGMR